MVGFALGRLTLYCVVVVVFVYAAMWRQCSDTPPLFLLEELSRPARLCVLQPEALVFFLVPQTCCGRDLSVNSTNIKSDKFIIGCSVYTLILASKFSEVKGKD